MIRVRGMARAWEVEVTLVRNPKAARRKGWMAEVDEEGNYRFLDRLDGTPYKATYEVEGGRFYVIQSDTSSHKNTRVSQDLHYADPEKQELVFLAGTYWNGRWTEVEINEEIFNEEEARQLKKAYRDATNGGKTKAVILKAMELFLQKIGAKQKSKEELIAEEIAELERKYGVKIRWEVVQDEEA